MLFARQRRLSRTLRVRVAGTSGNIVCCFALSAPEGGLRSRQLKTILTILALALLAAGPAAAESAKLVAPGHHLKGTDGQPGASYYAPGHQKRLHMSVRTFAPGHRKR